MDELHLFPGNGLDRSIMAAVFAGVLLMTLASETLGWTFAGLVVPGYLAAVFAISPVTGTAILLESVLAYALARAVGTWLPAAGAWSQAFGRERFFIVIAASLFVRLTCEGYLFPWAGVRFDYGRASELYSIGLVLIPLVANSAWNVGLVRGALQNTSITLLTYGVLRWVLLPYTNLSLSKIELSFERVALDFMAAPKAYLVLLVGTIFGARTNVRYGWDFNGILVPGLLAVAWYTPLKLVATLVEAVVVAGLAQRLVKTRLLRGTLIEGPRRLLLVFSVGFALKLALGFAFERAFPAETVTDFYGFGYVLPTLLSMKIWQYGSVPRVLMPTLSVSFLGFLGGNALGLWLMVVWPDAQVEAKLAPTARGPLALSLMLQGKPPVRGLPPLLSGDRLEAWREVLEQLLKRDVDGAQRRAHREGLSMRRYDLRRPGAVYVLRGSRGGYAPAVAVHPRGVGTLVLEGADLLEAAALAEVLIAQLEPALLVVVPEGAPELLELLEPVLGGRVGAPLRRLVLGDVYRLSGGVRADARALGRMGFRREDESWVLRGRRLALLRGALYQAPSQELSELSWHELAEAFKVGVPQAEAPPMARARLRAFSDTLLPRLSRWAEGEALSAETFTLLRWHDLSVRRLREPEGLVISDATDSGPEASFFWVVLRGDRELAVNVPRAGRELSSVRLGKLFARQLGARHLLLHQARSAARDATGRPRTLKRTPMQRTLEGLLAQGASVLELHERRHAEVAPGVDAVLASAVDVAPLPAWAHEVPAQLRRAGYGVVEYDGSRQTAFARGSAEPLMEYARALYPDRVVAVWLLGRLREAIRQSEDPKLVRFLSRSGLGTQHMPLSLALEELPRGGAGCDVSVLERELSGFFRTKNPYRIEKLAARSRSCNARLVHDPALGGPFLVGAERHRKFVLRLAKPAAIEPLVAVHARAATSALGLGASLVIVEEVKP